MHQWYFEAPAVVEPQFVVHVPLPPPVESFCHCDCGSFPPPFQPWDWSWPPLSHFSVSSSVVWVWVILSSCVFMSLLIIKVCLVHILQTHRAELNHVASQTFRPSLQNGCVQSTTRTESVGVQTDSIETSAVLGSSVQVGPSATLPLARGITTPSRRRQWQQQQQQPSES